MWVLLGFAAGTAAVVAFTFTPFAIPCLFRLLTGIPCPACGLSRAFVLLLQLDIWAALQMNILLLPLILGGIAYFVCAVLDFFCGKTAIARLNSLLAKKWIIALAAVLMLASWGYNIARGI
jgi:hypothetical protein